jgi:hypothetical protein
VTKQPRRDQVELPGQGEAGDQLAEVDRDRPDLGDSERGEHGTGHLDRLAGHAAAVRTGEAVRRLVGNADRDDPRLAGHVQARTARCGGRAPGQQRAASQRCTSDQEVPS